jgi:adenosine deaminase
MAPDQVDLPDELHDLCDLHMHLGSAATAHTLWEIAHDQGIALKEKDYWRFVDTIEMVNQDTYEAYLKRFDYTEKIQSSPMAVERCVYEGFSLSYRKANVRLLELRFNPVNRNSEGFYDLDKLIFSAIVGMKKATLIYPIQGGLILCMDRRLSPELNLIIAEKAGRFARDGVVGIDVAGPLVSTFSWEQIREPVRIARKNKLGVTIHTGEVTPPDEVWEVIETLQPDRIGHGVKSVQDKKLLDELARRKICLELCPTSNLRTRECIKDWDEMKSVIFALRDHGVRFTINSDNPVFLQTNVLRENEQLIENGILSREEVIACSRQAARESFIRSHR